MLHYTFLLSVNSLVRVGLTYWPSSGNLLRHKQCMFQLSY